MKRIRTSIIVFLFIVTPIMAGQISFEQRKTGEIVIKSLSVKDGKLSFVTDTGGCTTKKSFGINIETGKGIVKKVPNYIIKITRILPDECKAFFPEGIVIEYDLEKDLGIKGYYTISIKNMILPK